MVRLLQQNYTASIYVTNTVPGVKLFFMSNDSRLRVYSGLDSRYMISRIKPLDFNVLSLTTIATPHRGSAFADYMFESIGRTSPVPFRSQRYLRFFQLLELRACTGP